MKGRVKWIENVKFVGESESGHAVVMDGAAESGGENRGCRPMELLLLGMGGCSAFDVITMLKKSRQQVDDCEVELTAQRAETIPKVFTHIHAHFIITGKGLEENHIKRAIKLSAEKYCSASIMLGETAEVTHDYEIVDSQS
jgi:putative redox protein